MAVDPLKAMLAALQKAKVSPNFDDEDEEDGKPSGISIQRVSAIPVGKGKLPLPDDMEEMGDEGHDDEGDDEQDEDMNAKVVGVLQSDYPQIYEKITKQLSMDDGSDEDSHDLSELM